MSTLLDVSNESNKTSQVSSHRVDIISKLRRMKIQEDLIIQNVKKNFCEADNSFIKYDLEFKKYLTKCKTSYEDIKQLFDDLKCVTKTQDTLRNSDIDEVKKDVLELDEKIKTFKTFLHRELVTLKSTEQLIVKQMNEDKSPSIMVRKQTKIPTKTYSDIIPSPVRNIINSPFKYPEVQQFQDFLSHSNKYGGWNEYNHNIFIKLWHKYFQNNEDYYFHFEALDDTERNLFINDVFENVVGIARADIISHMEWYFKYLSLKKRQQLAIDEWRAKTKPKNPFQKRIEQPSSLCNEKEKACSQPSATRCLKTGIVRKCAELLCNQDNHEDYNILQHPISNAEQNVDANVFLKEMERIHSSNSSRANKIPEFRYIKPTKQWNNRCNSSANIQLHNNDLDKITKLGIPKWRFKLMSNDD